MIPKFKKIGKRSKFRTILFSILLLLFVFGTTAFLIFKNVEISKQKNKLGLQVSNLQKDIESLEKRGGILEQGISQVGNDEYVEKIAREELGLKKQDENVVGFILPQDQQNPGQNGQVKNSLWDFNKIWQWIKSKF